MRNIFLKNSKRSIITAVSLILVSGTANASARSEHQKYDFVLTDASQKTFRYSEHKGKILALSFVPDTDNRKTGSYWLTESRKWMEKLNQKLSKHIEIFGLKKMTNLPMFLPKSFIRGKLRKEPFPYLIDWNGKVFNLFSVKEKYTLIVLDTTGHIVCRTSAPFSNYKFKEVYTEIKKILGRDRQINKTHASKEQKRP